MADSDDSFSKFMNAPPGKGLRPHSSSKEKDRRQSQPSYSSSASAAPRYNPVGIGGRGKKSADPYATINLDAPPARGATRTPNFGSSARTNSRVTGSNAPTGRKLSFSQDREEEPKSRTFGLTQPDATASEDYTSPEPESRPNTSRASGAHDDSTPVVSPSGKSEKSDDFGSFLAGMKSHLEDSQRLQQEAEEAKKKQAEDEKRLLEDFRKRREARELSMAASSNVNPQLESRARYVNPPPDDEETEDEEVRDGPILPPEEEEDEVLFC